MNKASPFLPEPGRGTSEAGGGAAAQTAVFPAAESTATAHRCGTTPGSNPDVSLLLGETIAPWPLVPRTLLITILVVTIMTWVVAPQLTRLLKPWLHAGKH